MNFLNKRILAALLLLAVMLPFRNLAADHVTMTLQNPTSTANTLEFDVYIVNDGTSVLKLGGYQFGVNFSNTILNGGTPAANGSYTYVAGTRDTAFNSLSTPSIAYTASTSHLRVVSTTVASVYAGNLPIGIPKCLGRYRFTNTVNWLAASNPNLQFQLVTAGGKTQCIAACFVGGSNSSTALTNPLGTLSGTVIAPGFLLNVPLPVHISSFNGKKSGNEDILSWTTSQEENNDYFNLQHSADGINFSTIQKINSGSEKGNSQVTLNYTSKNTNPVSGHNFYRLEQVDIDGHTTIETGIVDLFRSSTGQAITVYPNPATDVLNLNFETEGMQNILIKVLDLNGRTVKKIVSVSNTGTNTDTIDIKDLTSGQYFIQLYTNDTLIFTDKVRKDY